MAFASTAALLAIGSTLLTAGGAIMAGDAENDAAKAEAEQLRINAGQERAVGQYNAAKMREDAKRLLSQQRAGLSATGFQATDGTAQALVADTATTATLEEMLETAQAEERARGMEHAGSVRRWEGKNAKRASRVKAGATLLEGLSGASGMMGGGRVPSPNKPPSKPSSWSGPR